MPSTTRLSATLRLEEISTGIRKFSYKFEYALGHAVESIGIFVVKEFIANGDAGKTDILLKSNNPIVVLPACLFPIIHPPPSYRLDTKSWLPRAFLYILTTQFSIGFAVVTLNPNNKYAVLSTVSSAITI